MKDSVLIELANRWESDAVENHAAAGGYPEGTEGIALNGKHVGERETLRACADTLRMLVDALGEKPTH